MSDKLQFVVDYHQMPSNLRHDKLKFIGHLNELSGIKE